LKINQKIIKIREGKPLISPQTLINHGRLQPFSSEKGFRKIRVQQKPWPMMIIIIIIIKDRQTHCCLSSKYING
jgi:hypothetical protein